MRVVLRKLECIRTRAGEQKEEPYLCIYADDLLRYVWGPESMRDGDTKPIDMISVDASIVGIILSEDDPGNRYDDHLGGIRMLEEDGEGTATMHMGGTGPYILDLPRTADGRYDHNDRHYKLYFDLIVDPEEDHLPQEPFCLDLISLHCSNAQEWKDYVFLKVNGEQVFEPRRMRTGSTAQLDSVRPIPIFYDTRIQLWEQDDSNRNDFFGEFRLWVWPGNFDFDNPTFHTFHADRGIVGDATYTLIYSVRRRVRDIDGNYCAC